LVFIKFRHLELFPPKKDGSDQSFAMSYPMKSSLPEASLERHEPLITIPPVEIKK
jgi:hypothetical protein